MSATGETEKVKKERSPSFPFIPLEKAVERLRALWKNHKLQPARISSVAVTWGYGVKSSGLLQTVAALKQYGLIEDMGTGDDRKVVISDLGRRIVQDERPGAREAALKEAATAPRLIAEYLAHWVPDRPSDAHCLSELQLERGFNEAAAKQFLHVFDDTVAYANLKDADTLSSSPSNPQEQDNTSMTAAAPIPTHASRQADPFGLAASLGAPKALAQRLKIELNAQSLAVTAVLNSAAEVDKLIKMLEANKALLSDEENP